MRAYLKQSGELLTTDPAELWTPQGVYRSAQQIAELHKNRRELDLQGLMVMSGAGNILRGVNMRREFASHSIDRIADSIGRLGTVQNTVVLSAALEDLDVPTQILVAPGMHIGDRALDDRMAPYSLRAEYEANARGNVVLVAGGDGQEGCTTDGAVLNLAHQSAAMLVEQQHRVLKATKHDGIFDADPRHEPDAQRYATISAQQMLGDMARFAAVDERCLQIMSTAPDNLSLHVYAANEHSAVEALMYPENIGTLVVPGEIEAAFAY